jgi:hypothetical protein
MRVGAADSARTCRGRAKGLGLSKHQPPAWGHRCRRGAVRTAISVNARVGTQS